MGKSPPIGDEIATAFILDKYNSGVALLKQDSNGNLKRLQTSQTVQPNGGTTYTQNNLKESFEWDRSNKPLAAREKWTKEDAIKYANLTIVDKEFMV